MKNTLLLFTLACLTSCSGTDKPEDSSAALDECDDSIDTDGDGLSDCNEAQLGTDPSEIDTDGDGVTDFVESDCSSDPLDADDACYACGWQKNDPGTLSETGTEVGDTIGNLQMVDQCGETTSLWDFYGEYHVLFMTAAW